VSEMETTWAHALDDVAALDLSHGEAEIVDWGGRRALRLEGLAVVPDLQRADATVEVLVGVDGPAYPGIAYRAADAANFELAYAVPHASGLWDALQYDPVWHGSNTWQLYYDPPYQQAAEVPTGRWFRLRLAYCGTGNQALALSASEASRAVLWVDDEPPLVVPRLAHPARAGRIGLWTYRPACFADLRISACSARDLPAAAAPPLPDGPAGAVDAWFVEGYGCVACEPGGRLVLNRYLPATMGQAQLTRRFETGDGEVVLRFGYSDTLSLALDGREVYGGTCTFSGFGDRAARGYAEPGTAEVREPVAAGTHTLVATLGVQEPFGWGMVLAGEGAGLRWLPAAFG
jgi:hypothetical protein